MPELQVFTSITFGQPAPAEPVEATDAPMPVVITPVDAPAGQPEPDAEVRDGVAKAPKRRPESSEQRKKP